MYIVTGVSKGLGKAIAEHLLIQGETVIGLGRNNTIEHNNYTYYFLDLNSELDLSFLELNIEGQVTLINNAGIIGEIDRISSQKNWDLDFVLKINTTSPMHLAKEVYKRMIDKSLFTLVNISSGAAKRSIPSWAAYCSSKAALNMLSESFALEERELGNSPKVYCVAPGVIDTDMQLTIRSTSKDKFSQNDRFVELKENGELYSPEECAIKLIRLLNTPYDKGIFYDLRDL